MLSAAPQLSLKGTLETLLTWTGSKTSRPPPREKAWQRRRDVFSVVVTPDRIPKFCIPSLEVDHLAVHAEPAEKSQEPSLGSTVPGEVVQRPRATRSQSEWCVRKRILGQGTWCRGESLESTGVLFSSEHLERAGDHSDPATRAALSLPHLPKITTPYGFLTLGESPNIRRKESLFFGYKSAELRFLLSQKKENACPSRHPTSPLMVQHQTRKWGNHSTKNRWPPSQDKLFDKQTPASLHCAPSSERGTSTHEKKRFRLLMRKHLPIIKKFRSNSASADRLVTLTERAMNSPVS